jgi:hypothetical protein
MVLLKSRRATDGQELNLAHSVPKSVKRGDLYNTLRHTGH